jgi:hypothetical protein
MIQGKFDRQLEDNPSFSALQHMLQLGRLGSRQAAHGGKTRLFIISELICELISDGEMRN